MGGRAITIDLEFALLFLDLSYCFAQSTQKADYQNFAKSKKGKTFNVGIGKKMGKTKNTFRLDP